MEGFKIDDNSRSIPAYSIVNISTATDTLVKTGAGVLHSISVTTPILTGTVEADDALTNTNALFPAITSPATLVPYTIVLDIPFTTGLNIHTTQNQSITITYL